MYRKLISSSILKVYNLLHRNRISDLYSEIKSNYEKRASRKDLYDRYVALWSDKGFSVDNRITTKADLKEFMSQLDLSNVRSWAYTGGSHGEPFRVPYSKKRVLVRTATFWFFNESVGYKAGDSFALIRAKNKSSLNKFLRNELIFIPTDISDNKLQLFVEQLIDKNVTFILGYPSVMYELAAYLTRNEHYKQKLKVRYLISTSEMLDDERRQLVHDAFCPKFVDRYANEEVGLIAQQESFNGDYIINPLNVIVEVVHPDTLVPVKSGELGKVLVTDVANDIVPIIRYDTGDLAIAGEYMDGELKTLKKVLGRVVERIYDTKGNPVSSLALGPIIYKPLSIENNMFQFQFAQIEANRFELRIKAEEGVIDVTTENLIQKNLMNVLGENACISIVYLDDIAPLPSGKRPIYVNETKC